MKPTTGTSNSRSPLVNILKQDEETSSPSKQKERNKMTELETKIEKLEKFIEELNFDPNPMVEYIEDNGWEILIMDTDLVENKNIR